MIRARAARAAWAASAYGSARGGHANTAVTEPRRSNVAFTESPAATGTAAVTEPVRMTAPAARSTPRAVSTAGGFSRSMRDLGFRSADMFMAQGRKIGNRR